MSHQRIAETLADLPPPNITNEEASWQLTKLRYEAQLRALTDCQAAQDHTDHPMLIGIFPSGGPRLLPPLAPGRVVYRFSACGLSCEEARLPGKEATCLGASITSITVSSSPQWQWYRWLQ